MVPARHPSTHPVEVSDSRLRSVGAGARRAGPESLPSRGRSRPGPSPACVASVGDCHNTSLARREQRQAISERSDDSAFSGLHRPQHRVDVARRYGAPARDLAARVERQGDARHPGSSTEGSGHVEPEGIVLLPAIWPASLMAMALLKLPPSVPRSIIVPSSQRNAWQLGARPPQPPSDVELKPTTWPRWLMSTAWLNVPPRVRGPGS